MALGGLDSGCCKGTWVERPKKASENLIQASQDKERRGSTIESVSEEGFEIEDKVVGLTVAM